MHHARPRHGPRATRAARGARRAAEAARKAAQRGAPGKAFDPADGSGYVSAHEGDYAEPLRRKHEVLLLLFETFGGFGPDVMRLLKRMRKHTRDKMTKTQYEHEASWSTRTWGSLMCQRLSVALHKAAAQELINELHWGMGPSSAPAPGRGSDEQSYSSSMMLMTQNQDQSHQQLVFTARPNLNGMLSTTLQSIYDNIAQQQHVLQQGHDQQQISTTSTQQFCGQQQTSRSQILTTSSFSAWK